MRALVKQLHKLNSNFGTLVIAFCVVISSESAWAVDLTRVRIGGALGYGGVGVTQFGLNPVVASGSTAGGNLATTGVSRSESPGIASLSIDYLLTDYWMLSMDHTRGFRFSPYSSGAAFTGLTGRWFFSKPLPSYAKKSTTESTVIIKRYSWFWGFSLGVGSADILRENDAIPEVKSAGVYTGTRVGVEYPVNFGAVYRMELGIMFSLPLFKSSQPATSTSAAIPADSVSAFMLQFGFYFSP